MPMDKCVRWHLTILLLLSLASAARGEFAISFQVNKFYKEYDMTTLVLKLGLNDTSPGFLQTNSAIGAVLYSKPSKGNYR